MFASPPPQLFTCSATRLIKQMLVEMETLKVLDGELAEIVPDDELEEEIQRADEYKESSG